MIYLSWLRSSVSSYVDLIWHILHRNEKKDEPSSISSWLGLGQKASNTTTRSASEVNNSSRPPLWALIIGINAYPKESNFLPLSGAVPDADAMNQYLLRDLHIPARQITNMRDGKATREGIISALKALANHPEINEGDPILIYFAGHGGEVPVKGVQTLIPVDYIPDKNPPIPDRTVAALINGISKKKGNNITVIFDCCHSGSGARGEDDGVSVRGGELHPNDAPDGLDADICAANAPPKASGGTRGLRVAKGFANQDMNSHVLLAACSATEQAREDKKLGVAQGRFTGALLELLRSVTPDQITYFEVLTKMPIIEGQNPQVEGFNQKRIFFDAKVVPPTRNVFDLKVEKDSKSGKDKYVLQAGRAHGLTDGAEFTLYKDKNSIPDHPLGKMLASDKKIRGFTSELAPIGAAPQAFGSPAVAVQTKAGASEDLKIHVPLESQYLPVFEAIAKEMDGIGPELCRLKLVDKDNAKLGIVADGGQIAFDVLEKRAKAYGFERIPFKVDNSVEDIHRVLRAASHYHYHLNVDHPNKLIKEGIKIEFFSLKDDVDDEGYDIRIPDSKDLTKSGKVEVLVDDDTYYGMKITNNTPWDLHFACFYFDHAELSISALTEMSAKTAYKRDPTLPKGSIAEMGYGRLGIPPFQCDIPEGIDLAIGFLKFYFTAEHVDLSHIPLSTPFTGARGIKQSIDRNDVWGTALVPVVLKRG